MSDINFFYNGIDLRTATVFELTNDAQYLNRFLSPELGIKTLEDYKALGEINDLERATTMLEFAEEKNITELIKKLQSIYKDELAAFFNE